jgi:outer membrane protein assembly factor BamB
MPLMRLPLTRSLVLCGLLVASLMVSACGASKKPPLLGDRISVLKSVGVLQADPALETVAVELPRPELYADWPQAGSFPDHARHHLALGDTVALAWQTSIGSGSHRRRALQTPPIVADGRVYAIDTEGMVTALAMSNGQQIWRAPTIPDDEDDTTVSGAMAFAEGRLYVASAAAELVVLDAASGKELWRKPLPSPVRVAPTVAGERVFVVGIDNQMVAMSAKDGQRLWSHSGITETAGLLGGGAVAVSGDYVVVPYSSGELFALRLENGRLLWADNLSGVRQSNAVAGLASIRGNPVIDRGVVYAASHAGRLGAIELRSGERIWDKELSVAEDVWVAGDYLFFVTTTGEVVCLTRTDGRIRWVHALPRFANEKNQEDPIRWSGPVLAGDRLLLVNNLGKIAAVSPYTGAFLGDTSLPGSASLAPIVVGNSLYVLTEDGRLAAYR